MSTLPLKFPAFPEPGRSSEVSPDSIPTETYNWCVSPFTPMAVSGVIWVPGQFSIGHDPADYATELEAYAKSLPATFGRESVPFYHALPTAGLVAGITTPKLPGAKHVEMSAWPKSLEELAIGMARLVE